MTELTFLISVQNLLSVPSCFRTKMQGEAQADDNGTTILFNKRVVHLSYMVELLLNGLSIPNISVMLDPIGSRGNVTKQTRNFRLKSDNLLHLNPGRLGQQLLLNYTEIPIFSNHTEEHHQAPVPHSPYAPALLQAQQEMVAHCPSYMDPGLSEACACK